MTPFGMQTIAPPSAAPVAPTAFGGSAPFNAGVPQPTDLNALAQQRAVAQQAAQAGAPTKVLEEAAKSKGMFGGMDFSKLMNPDFGTIIWNVVHEPLTEDLKSVIVTDIKAIAGYDPRISIDNVVITEYDQGIQVELQLRYVQTNQTNLLNLQFDNQNNTLTAA